MDEGMTDVFGKLEEFYYTRYKDWDGKAQFEGTGERLLRMVEEMCWPTSRVEKEIEKYFCSTFEDGYDEMLVSGPTLVHVLCPHHLLPCSFKVYIGYIPNGKVLGLSKFSRVATAIGKRPIMQEQYSRELAYAFEKNLSPSGVGVYVEGSHGCMGCRGIEQEDIRVVTSVLKGIFLKEPGVKEEFLKLVSNMKGNR